MFSELASSLGRRCDQEHLRSKHRLAWPSMATTPTC